MRKILYNGILCLFLCLAFSCSQNKFEPNTALDAGKVKPHNKSSSSGVLIANEVNGITQFIYTQVAMKTALVNAYQSVYNVTVTPSSGIDAEIVSEINPDTQIMEYELVLSITKASGEYETFGVLLNKSSINGSYKTANVESARLCSSISCVKCSRRCNRCRSGAGNCYRVSEKVTSLMEGFESELTAD